MKKTSAKTQTKKMQTGAIKKLLKFARPYLPYIIGALIFSVIQIVATLLAPVIIGNTVDYIVGKDNVDFGVILKNSGILGGLIAAAFLFARAGMERVIKYGYPVIGVIGGAFITTEWINFIRLRKNTNKRLTKFSRIDILTMLKKAPCGKGR